MHPIQVIVGRRAARPALVVAAFVGTACGGGEPAADATPDTTAIAVPAEAPLPDALTGTTWRLVEIQSMDDAQGPTRPVEPSAFTMTLAADGTVSMRLDCNRANGTWSATAVADGTNGTFAFGPLVGTRALCPEPRIDERITAQAEYVRGWILQDGRLGLSLMADGGIQVWEPATTAGAGLGYSAEPDPVLEDAIRGSSPSYTGDVIGDMPGATYVYGRIDLDGDGRNEILVYPMGSIFCGTGGCTLMLFSDRGDGLVLVGEFPITQTPVKVAETATGGWRDLIRHEAGGGMPSTWVRHVWDGTGYAEAERTDTEPAGTVVIPENVSYSDGAPLSPGG